MTARQIISKVWEEKRHQAMFYLSLLADQNIRGEQIVLAMRKAKTVNDLCQMLEHADHTLIQYINQHYIKERARYR